MPPALESVDDIDYVFRLRQDLLFFTFSRLHGLSVDVNALHPFPQISFGTFMRYGVLPRYSFSSQRFTFGFAFPR